MTDTLEKYKTMNNAKLWDCFYDSPKCRLAFLK